MRIFLLALSVLTIIFSASPEVSSQNNPFTLISEDSKGLLIRVNPSSPDFQTVNTPEGAMVIPLIAQGVPIMKTGYPDLPQLTTSVIIPDQGNAVIEVISESYYDLPDMNICPSKGNLLRTQDPELLPWQKGPVYQTGQFWPDQRVTGRDPYILRDHRGMTLVVSPLAYNPTGRVLRVYTEIVLEVKWTQSAAMNEKTSTGSSARSDEFEAIYQRHFLNIPAGTKYTPVGEDGNMLIISHSSFIPAMQPFIMWKNQKGIATEIVDVATIGNSAQIKAYVANYYNTKGLTWLLLVGDHAQVPSSSTSAGPSDNDYAYILGNDHYPELFVGRFSAETVDHVVTQVERSVTYEKYPDPVGTWYGKGAGIASNQGPGHDNLYDHEHIRLLRGKMLAYTYDSITEHYDGDQGLPDLPGDPTASEVFNAINPGSGAIIYCGHGWDQGWGSSGYSNTQVDQMTNVNRLPFIWSVACVNGNFTAGTCFAEAWLRSTYNNQPAGAIATLMSTINQSWNPPMSGQLEMVDLLTETYLTNVKHSFGGISMNGCMQMNDDYGSGGDEMTDTWTVFGDPSIVVRTATPGAMTVTHPAQTIIGNDNITIQCNIYGALACLSINGSILGKGMISGGSVNITFSPLTTIDTIDVVVTAYNKQTYLGYILVIPPAGPYVIRDLVVIDDAMGNGNGLADFGENISLNVSLKNVGVDSAQNVTATLSSVSSAVTITDNTETYGNIQAGTSLNKNNAYAFTINALINDQEMVPFTLTATDGTDTWNSNFLISLNAPELEVTDVQINDNAGNQNGRLDPGETLDLVFTTRNEGHAAIPSATGSISCSSPYVSILTNNINTGSLSPATDYQVSFSISIDPAAPVGALADFNYSCLAAPYSAGKLFSAQIGLNVEDWEANHFHSFPWDTTVFGNAPWQIISGGDVYEGDFAARSGVITDDQSSTLIINIQVSGDDSVSFYKKVSCEEGSLYSQWWDYLVFYIDGVLKGQWDGEKDWSREAYFISAGNHTLTWTYAKDYVVSEGDDAAWVDFIVFPPPPVPSGQEEGPLVRRSITAYPNPASNLLNIDLGLGQDETGRIILLNAYGQVVRTVLSDHHMSNGQHRISTDVNDFPSGLYFIRYMSEEISLIHPVMITR